ncbi:hypothetical protein N7471_011343 [Penicillium samsonianum]|uniref:uncharacterized protein n=1 Tax=Penicillium samsonianum TaxID=1882272 RepID=UPI002548B26E|nr:uncharacterized protein N7471_011343 [Penicillium samsonianum]KAJ6124026.1 hypothetical protein N7471_011343 [Penicillium samsonianum]
MKRSMDARTPLDDNGTNVTYSGGYLNLTSVSQWKISGPPPNPADIKGNFDPATESLWKPKNRRLNDGGVVYALLTLSPKYRSDNFPYDFDKRGEVRRTRVP